jgi:hypothetical protein
MCSGIPFEKSTVLSACGVLSSIHSRPLTVCTAYSQSQSSTVPASMLTGLLFTTTTGTVLKTIHTVAVLHDIKRTV